MCLQVETGYPKQKDGAIRYKVLSIRQDGRLISPIKSGLWKLGNTKTKKIKKRQVFVDSCGFHVHVLLSNAISWRVSSQCIVECACKGFVAGGHGQEIWTSVKPISIVKKPQTIYHRELLERYILSRE